MHEWSYRLFKKGVGTTSGSEVQVWWASLWKNTGTIKYVEADYAKWNAEPVRREKVVPCATLEEGGALCEKVCQEKLAQGFLEYDIDGKLLGAAAAKKGPKKKARPASKNPLVARLAGALAKERPDYLEALEPGAKASEVAAFEKELGRPLPQTLRDLFLWQGGCETKAFMNNECLMGLGKAQGVWELHVRMAAEERERPGWWSRGWVPFLENGAGDFECVDLAGAFTGRAGQLVSFVHDDDDRFVGWPSFDAWLEFVVAALEAGEWELDDDENVELGGEASDAVRKRVQAGWESSEHDVSEPLNP